MSFRLSLPVIIYATCTFTFGQEGGDRPNVELGRVLESDMYREYSYILEATEDGLLAETGPHSDRYFKRVDHNYDVIASRSIPMKFGMDEHSSMISIIIGDELHVISRFDRETNEAAHIYHRSYDRRSLEPINDMRQVGSLPVTEKGEMSYLGCRVSPKESMILIHHRANFSGYEGYHLAVHDADLNLEWEREITLPYSKEEFETVALMVDDNGAVMILGYRFHDSKKVRDKLEKKGDLIDRTYHLLIVGETGRIEDHRIEIQNKRIGNMDFELSKNGDIQCFGFFGNVNVPGLQGPFFMRLDGNTKKISHLSYKEFDPEMMSAYLASKRSRKSQRKKYVDIMDFNPELLYMRDDGSALFISEERDFFLFLLATIMTSMRSTMISCS